MFKVLNKVQTSLLMPFIISSCLIVLSEIFLLIKGSVPENFQSLSESLSELFTMLIPFVFCYFLTLVMTNGKRGFKAFWSVLCLAVANTCIAVMTDEKSIFVMGLIVSGICIYCFKNFESLLAVILSVVCCAIIGLLFGYVNEYFNNFIMWLGGIISDKRIFSSGLFALFDSIFSLLDISRFRDVFFFKSYGGSMFVNDSIVTGAKDLFNAGYSGRLISSYLSGHFYMLFSVLGIGISLSNEIKDAQKITLLIVMACSILSGNLSLFLIFLFLETPFLFFSAVLINVLSYISAYVLDIGMGYAMGGSVIEMIMNLKNPVYLISGGIVFVCIGFFTTKYIVEKHGISDCVNIYIPTRLNPLVKNLGGIENIIRFKDDKLEVRNPELINTLELDCVIEENIVTSSDEHFADLKDYL